VSRRWLISAASGAAGVLLVSSSKGRRTLRRAAELAIRKARYEAGRAKGVQYRLSGRHPSTEVDVRTLTDRVRSMLGPLEKRLDLPHIHVMAEDHAVLLHGEVASKSDADEIERAVRQTAGVERVESYLHVGLIRGDTRPSEGRNVRPVSEAPPDSSQPLTRRKETNTPTKRS
jgi:osmotically-inducible protein OsmY